jgi:hypothetical protein
MREALLGMNACVLKVNTILKIPEKRVNKPRIHAVERRVMSGLMMQMTPRAMRRIPEMQSQIFLLVFII